METIHKIPHYQAIPSGVASLQPNKPNMKNFNYTKDYKLANELAKQAAADVKLASSKNNSPQLQTEPTTSYALHNDLHSMSELHDCKSH